MPETLIALLPTLAFLASTAGAGWAASALFALARARLPRPTPAQWARLTPLGRLLTSALYAPRYARLTVFALAALVSLAATVIAAVGTGQGARPALDAALAVIVSQLVHAAGLGSQAAPGVSRDPRR